MLTGSRVVRGIALSALGCHVALAGWLVAWLGFLAPLPGAWAPAFAVALALPLAIALPGIVRGRAYTHAWASLVTPFYLALALMELAAGPEPRGYALTATLLALGAFTGSLAYVRLSARRA